MPATSDRIARTAARLWRENGTRAVTFGSVASESAASKSLVSHHFRSHRDLLLAAGDLLAEEILARLDALAAAIETLDEAGRRDGPAILVERLMDGEAEYAACLLEICSLSLSDPQFRRMLTPMLGAIRRIAGLAGADADLILTVILGELLQLLPLPRSPLAPRGLYERMRLFVTPRAEHRALVDGFRMLASTGGEAAAASPAIDIAPAPAAADRREQIVLAALNLLARGEDPSHRAIAAEAGISLSATTYYFTSRTDIVIGIYEYIQSGARAGAESAAIAEVSDIQAFIDALNALLPYYPEHPGATTAHLHLVLLAARTPELRDWAARAQEAEILSLRDVLERLLPGSGADLGKATLSVISGIALKLLLGLETQH